MTSGGLGRMIVMRYRFVVGIEERLEIGQLVLKDIVLSS
jgi:hypothetical protein